MCIALNRQCNLLSLNQQSNYVKKGMENRILYNQFLSLSLERDIAVGDTVSCRDGYGTLQSYNESSLVINLQPWECVSTYKPGKKARMTRWEPSLMWYQRLKQYDTVSQLWKDTIDSFTRSHNAVLPNLKDIITRQHPKYPRQTQSAPCIWRWESWNEIWKDFQIKYSSIAAQIQYPAPNESKCPMHIRYYAPLEMRKGKNSSCLCIHCKGTNAARCGTKVVINLITVGASDNDTPILCLPASLTTTAPSAEVPIAEVEAAPSAEVPIAEVEESASIAEVDVLASVH